MLEFRAPEETDWSSILALAERSVADVPGAPPQNEWLTNRQGFAAVGEQHHFVVCRAGAMVGYGAVEHAPDAPAGAYRMFVVTAPDDLPTVGLAIYTRAGEILDDVRASASWFVEYSDAARLNEFISARGYTATRRFRHGGADLVVLSKRHDGTTPGRAAMPTAHDSAR